MRLGGGGRGGVGSCRGGGGRSSWKFAGRIPGMGGGVGGGATGGGGNKGGGPLGAAEGAAADDSKSDADKAVGLWAAYAAALEKDPLLIKGLTSMTGFLLGDVLAQLFIEKGQYDVVRTIRMASFGLLVHGTTGHWFYGKLDAAIVGTGAAQVASKVAIDQIIWNPIFGVMFFGYMGLFEGAGLDGTVKKIKRDLMKQVTGSWTVWPIAHAINFRFIPNSQRILYINSIQIFYNCFLSIIGNKK